MIDPPLLPCPPANPPVEAPRQPPVLTTLPLAHEEVQQQPFLPPTPVSLDQLYNLDLDWYQDKDLLYLLKYAIHISSSSSSLQDPSYALDHLYTLVKLLGLDLLKHMHGLKEHPAFAPHNPLVLEGKQSNQPSSLLTRE